MNAKNVRTRRVKVFAFVIVPILLIVLVLFILASGPGGTALSAVSARPMSFEFRQSNGSLECLVTCGSMEPTRNAAGAPVPGKFAGKNIAATYYFDNGQTARARADSYVLQTVAGPPGGLTAITDAALSGNVEIVVAPSSSRSTSRPTPSLKIYFDRDLNINVPTATLTGLGSFHLNAKSSPISGTGFHAAIVRTTRMLDYVRSDTGDAQPIEKAIKATPRSL